MTIESATIERTESYWNGHRFAHAYARGWGLHALTRCVLRDVRENRMLEEYRCGEIDACLELLTEKQVKVAS